MYTIFSSYNGLHYSQIPKDARELRKKRWLITRWFFLNKLFIKLKQGNLNLTFVCVCAFAPLYEFRLCLILKLLLFRVFLIFVFGL